MCWYLWTRGIKYDISIEYYDNPTPVNGYVKAIELPIITGYYYVDTNIYKVGIYTLVLSYM